MAGREKREVGTGVSDRGHVIHAPWCNVPLNEHSGNEACLVWEEEKISAMPVVAHYKQGPQGNLVADHRADFLARYSGNVPKIDGPLGTPEIEDRRNNGDPAEIGAAWLAARAAERNGTEPS